MELTAWLILVLAAALVLGFLWLIRRALGVRSGRERHLSEAYYETEARLHQWSSHDSITHDH
jgi:hypothetical protein